MENQALKPTVSAGNLHGDCQSAPGTEAEDKCPNRHITKRAENDPSRKKPSQINASARPSDLVRRTKSTSPNQGQPPKLILEEDGQIDLLSMSSLPEAFGTTDRGLTGKLLVEAVGTIPDLESVDVNKINPVIAAIHAIGPRDALEGMLAVQMVSVHNVAMERLRRATASLPLGEDSNVNAATKLLRAFAALMEAQIRIIAASSPQAKGRVERNHGIHQDRLIKKLRRKGIASYEAANEFLKKEYLPHHNRRFAQVPAKTEDYHGGKPTAGELGRIFRLGLTQQQLLTESRIAIITQGLAGRYSRGSDHLQAL